MRKALVVGIDRYLHATCLNGCVNDAHSVKSVLERHGDGSINFAVKLVTATDAATTITRGQLKGLITELFSGDDEIALFYFAGHGHIEQTGGYIETSEIQAGDDGLALSDVISLASRSRCQNKIIILDSCHSGVVGARTDATQTSEIGEGMTILTASTAEQYASESDGSGVFTALLVDALSGAASNLVGDISPGSVYAHIDQSLGPWEQRPVFKTNVKKFVSIRKTQPPIPLSELRRIAELFPEPGFDFPLDPSFEPTSDEADPLNTVTFSLLQKYNRINLLTPIGEDHMYFAAMNSKSCKLTVLGEHYRRLVCKGQL